MSKPVLITQSVGPGLHQPLYQEVTVSATATNADNSIIVLPVSTGQIKNYNGKTIAYKYAATGDFYFTSSRGRFQNDYVQVVTEGNLTFYTSMSIDGVNWVTAGPTGAPTAATATAPVSSLVSFTNSPVGMNYKITVPNCTGNYYINLLN